MTVGNRKIATPMGTNKVLQQSSCDRYLKEVNRFERIIRDSIGHYNRMKSLDIINGSELNQSILSIEPISAKLLQLREAISKSSEQLTEQQTSQQHIDVLQGVNNDMSLLFRSYGTANFRDLVAVCLGNTFLSRLETNESTSLYGVSKWSQIAAHVHPISYKVLSWKGDGKQVRSTQEVLRKNRIVEDIMIVENAATLDCFDLARTTKEFNKRVYGIKVTLQDEDHRKTLIVSGITDDIPLWTFGSNFFDGLKTALSQCDCSKTSGAVDESLGAFIWCLTLKDCLIYGCEDLFLRYVGFKSEAQRMHQAALSSLVSEFLNADRYTQRTMLLQLLNHSHKPEFQYLAYLMFDLLSSDTSNVADTHEQTCLFDSLPSKAKQFFKEALKRTVQYTNTLSNFESHKIPLEQQICLMKASDTIKERAMQKLKEVKNKNEDSGTKARQYLEGLLRIPFGTYRNEPILTIMDGTRATFRELIVKLRTSPLSALVDDIPVRQSYTGMEVTNYLTKLRSNYNAKVCEKAVQLLHSYADADSNATRTGLSELIQSINQYLRSQSFVKARKLPISGRSIPQMQSEIHSLVEYTKTNASFVTGLTNHLGLSRDSTGLSLFDVLDRDMKSIEENALDIKQYIGHVNSTLTKAVHGHERAKRQVERIIGQWINGEQTGYCFGFEGPPGVGKTSLAKKGIAKCLQDRDGESRPFTFIAIGGASNGSTLEGHNYTYVASTWGRIVDVLMEKKCMNPIIFIDELDKVSRTEHGREIIGILTHLIDPTQNDSFQDKYFNGIDLDLSKALFIFSYNDVDAIDRILLDRIHRIKFDALTLDDKLTITKNYLVPEVLEKMGLVDVIEVPDEAILFIIEKYTNEPGVRKLRELLFEIIGEINLSALRGESSPQLPIVVNTADIENIYLKDRNTVRPYVITRNEPTIGVINGLYANSLGKGGVLPIEVAFLPSSQLLDLHLTGMQGDVMKESMQVARTLAFQLAGDKLNECIAKTEGKQYKTGFHIHVPEGATKKDGPSAGTAITMAIYSCITGIPIYPHIAVTGEICLSGRVTAIGGLEEKVIGGIKAGVKHFLFPKENQKDYEKIVKTYGQKKILEGIVFTAIETIGEAMSYALVKDE